MSDHSPAPADRALRGVAALPTLDFRKRYEPDWLELDEIVDRVLHDGLTDLSAAELQHFIRLYRRTIGSLALAREIVLDRALIDYLESLAARAYLALHGSTRPRARPLVELLWRGIPRAVRSLGAELGSALVLLALGVVIGWMLTVADPTWFWAFVPDGLAAGRSPAERTEVLEATLYFRATFDSSLPDFAGFLFVHNVEIGLLAFGLGFALGLPSAFLLFTNGLTLGAFCALFFERDLGLAFLGWLLPHGVPELAAVALCGAAGLAIGRALLFPGGRPPLRALQDAGRAAALVVLGAVILFGVAAAIEGVFRQLVVSDAGRFGLVAFNVAWIAAWLGLGGQPIWERLGRRERAGEGAGGR